MVTSDSSRSSWLTLLSLSTNYERRARLLPAIASLAPLLPLSLALGSSIVGWAKVLVGAAGVGVVFAVALAHLASAFGNRLQDKLWPEWPHDLPTNAALRPDSAVSSSQQRSKWYEDIRALTGLDIQAAVDAGDAVEIQATINDAVERIRNRIKRGRRRARHEQESIHYGYARNLAGLSPVWLLFSLVSLVGSWLGHLGSEGELLWAVVATIVPVPAFYVALGVLPAYVRKRGHYYGEVFFRLLEEEASEARQRAGSAIGGEE